MNPRRIWSLVAIVVVAIVVIVALRSGDDPVAVGETSTTSSIAVSTTGAPGESTTSSSATTVTTGIPASTSTSTTVVIIPEEIIVEPSVDIEEQTITVGLLADLSGPNAEAGAAIVAAQTAYWDRVNATGGVHDFKVVIEVGDTASDVDTQQSVYEDMKSRVVGFSHTTGDEGTLALNPSLQADSVLAITSDRYSGWADPVIGTNVVSAGAPYCISAMNVIGYMADEVFAEHEEPATFAVVSDGTPRGRDLATGARSAANHLGLEVYLDDTASVTVGGDLEQVIIDIIESDADIIYVAVPFDVFLELYQAARDEGVAGRRWAGAYGPVDFALLSDEIGQVLSASYFGEHPGPLWGDDAPGMTTMMRALVDADPAALVSDSYSVGWVEATIMESILRAAIEAGDLTHSGVLAAAQSVENVTLDGLAPDMADLSGASTRLARSPSGSWIPDGYAALPGPAAVGDADGFSGSRTLVSDYIHGAARTYGFQGACWQG